MHNLSRNGFYYQEEEYQINYLKCFEVTLIFKIQQSHASPASQDHHAFLLRKSKEILVVMMTLDADQELVTCDNDFLHISKALNEAKSKSQLRVIHISEQGQLTHASRADREFL